VPRPRLNETKENDMADKQLVLGIFADEALDAVAAAVPEAAAPPA
jgi:hypothetical protein